VPASGGSALLHLALDLRDHLVRVDRVADPQGALNLLDLAVCAYEPCDPLEQVAPAIEERLRVAVTARAVP